MYTVRIQNYFGEDIELEVDGWYEPYEATTRHYPGQSECFCVEEAFVKETGAEVCLIGGADLDLQDQILDDIHEDQAYAKYGYLME